MATICRWTFRRSACELSWLHRSLGPATIQVEIIHNMCHYTPSPLRNGKKTKTTAKLAITLHFSFYFFIF
eukprot:m.63383 g.63383  ORF g.63383 m.63383 type:complete len:70 (+) comp13443_c0_seq1:1105-1314(+)